MKKYIVSLLTVMMCLLTAAFPLNALASDSTSSNSSEGSSIVPFLSRPSAPSDLKATALSSSKIKLTWGAISSADHYYIYRTTSSSGTYKQIASVYTEYYTDSNLTADTTYYYKLRSVKSSGVTSSFSSTISETTSSSDSGSDSSDDLTAPANLTATATSSSEVYLKWDSVSSAVKYYVYRATSLSGNYSKIAAVSTPYYTNSGLRSERTYYYKVKAMDSAGDSSEYSSKVSVTTGSSDVVTAPANLTATATNSSEIYLEWDAVDSASEYYVYRATSSSGSYSKIASVLTPYYTNSNLKADKTYYYQVKAVDSAGKTSASSSTASVTTGSSDIVTAPTNVTATSGSSNEICLEWDSVNGASEYYVYRATSSSGNYLKITSVSTPYYTDSDLTEDKTYYYKIKAVDSAGDTSASSSIVSAKVGSSTALSAPEDVFAMSLTSSKIFICWDSDRDASAFKVYRADSSSGTYSEIASVSTSYYIDTDLTASQTYYYKVKAVNSSSTSDYSSEVKATTESE